MQKYDPVSRAEIQKKIKLCQHRCVEYYLQYKDVLKPTDHIVFAIEWLNDPSKIVKIGNWCDIIGPPKTGCTVGEWYDYLDEYCYINTIGGLTKELEEEKELNTKNSHDFQSEHEVLVYDVYICDGVSDFIHGGPHIIQEIFVPCLQLCLNMDVSNDHIYAFQSNVDRFVADDTKKGKPPRKIKIVATNEQLQMFKEQHRLVVEKERIDVEIKKAYKDLVSELVKIK
ncbi:MAG: hypothetical protein Sylvanvirus7_15 [Sylvanvirus sp.]|uniref:Uncharacterized protein n=1 Tax=Sylvanvirus sp. TaxID=2487774 RepID=A0A3G5AHP2_9VIRU|nr:MAG: hypothetical protein Sylvanvirus7_15 [Sylvanvirus sp.]